MPDICTQSCLSFMYCEPRLYHLAPSGGDKCTTCLSSRLYEFTGWIIVYGCICVNDAAVATVLRLARIRERPI